MFTLTDPGEHLVHNGVCRFPFWILWWIIGGAILNQTMGKSSCHKLCTWMVSLLHGSSNGTSSLLILKISCHTLCNWMASLQCDSLHQSSPDVEKLLSHLLHFNGCFLQGSSDSISSLLIMKISCHTLSNWMISLQCDSLHESSPDVEKLLSHLVHSNGCFLQGSSDGTSSLLIMKISCHTLCNWLASLQCNSLHES